MIRPCLSTRRHASCGLDTYRKEEVIRAAHHIDAHQRHSSHAIFYDSTATCTTRRQAKTPSCKKHATRKTKRREDEKKVRAEGGGTIASGVNSRAQVLGRSAPSPLRRAANANSAESSHRPPTYARSCLARGAGAGCSSGTRSHGQAGCGSRSMRRSALTLVVACCIVST